MTLTFDVREEGGAYTLLARTDGTRYEIRATDRELRRLLVDLHHTLEIEGSMRVPEDPDP